MKKNELANRVAGLEKWRDDAQKAFAWDDQRIRDRQTGAQNLIADLDKHRVALDDLERGFKQHDASVSKAINTLFASAKEHNNRLGALERASGADATDLGKRIDGLVLTIGQRLDALEEDRQTGSTAGRLKRLEGAVLALEARRPTGADPHLPRWPEPMAAPVYAPQVAAAEKDDAGAMSVSEHRDALLRRVNAAVVALGQPLPGVHDARIASALAILTGKAT